MRADMSFTAINSQHRGKAIRFPSIFLECSVNFSCCAVRIVVIFQEHVQVRLVNSRPVYRQLEGRKNKDHHSCEFYRSCGSIIYLGDILCFMFWLVRGIQRFRVFAHLVRAATWCEQGPEMACISMSQHISWLEYRSKLRF
jgi:hypothetical protein